MYGFTSSSQNQREQQRPPPQPWDHHQAQSAAAPPTIPPTIPQPPSPQHQQLTREQLQRLTPFSFQLHPLQFASGRLPQLQTPQSLQQQQSQQQQHHHHQQQQQQQQQLLQGPIRLPPPLSTAPAAQTAPIITPIINPTSLPPARPPRILELTPFEARLEKIVPIPLPEHQYKYAGMNNMPHELVDLILHQLVRISDSPVSATALKTETVNIKRFLVLKKYTPGSRGESSVPLAQTDYLHPFLALSAVSKAFKRAVEDFCTRACRKGEYVKAGEVKGNKLARNVFLQRLWTCCAFCGVRSIRKGTIAKFMHICAACDHKHFPTIPMTQAKRKYGLTESQLQDPYNNIRRGTCQVQGNPAMTFDAIQVQKFAERFHGMTNEEYHARKKAKKIEGEDAVRAKKQRVIDAVEAGMRANNLQPKLTALGNPPQTLSIRSSAFLTPLFTAHWLTPLKLPTVYVKYELMVQQVLRRVKVAEYCHLFGETDPAPETDDEARDFCKTLTVGPEWNSEVRTIVLCNLCFFHIFLEDFAITVGTENSYREIVEAYLELVPFWDNNKSGHIRADNAPWSLENFPLYYNTPDFPAGLASEEDVVKRHITRQYQMYPKKAKVDERKQKIGEYLNGDYKKLKEQAWVESYLHGGFQLLSSNP